MRSKEPILLVEDDKVDVMSVQRAFKAMHYTSRFKYAQDEWHRIPHDCKAGRVTAEDSGRSTDNIQGRSGQSG